MMDENMDKTPAEESAKTEQETAAAESAAPQIKTETVETEGIDMINTEKVYRSYDDPNDRKITVDQMIEKIMTRTGVTKEQAAEALEKNNNDLLDAMIYIERTYGPSSKAQAQPQPQPQQTQQQAYQQAQPQQQAYQAYNGVNLNEKKYTGTDVKNTIRKIIDVLVNNNFVIYKDGAEVLDIPVLVAIIAAMVSFSTVLIAAVVAMFFGVTCRLKGPDIAEPKTNVVFDTISNMAKNVKNAFTSQKY